MLVANQIASGWDEVFVVVNTLLAGAACGFNAAAAFSPRRRSTSGRAIHSAIAVLALVYTAAYGYLAIADVEVVRWSSVMRGVSIAAWVVAWIAPTFIRERTTEDIIVAQVVEKLEARGVPTS